MLNKFYPLILVSAAFGGGASIYFLESEIQVSSIVQNTTKDADHLRDRNPGGFKLTDAKNVGSVWKTNSEGSVFKDETYYVFEDWSWMNGVKIGSGEGQEFSGGEKLKSYIDGVGLKVEKIDDQDTYSSNQRQKKRDITVKRVLMSNYEGWKYWGGYRVFDKDTCFLKADNSPASSKSNLYLLIGFATGKDIQRDSGKRPEDFRLFNGHKSFCSWYANGNYDSNKKEINISFQLADGKTITGKEYPVISNKGFSPIYFEVGPNKVKANVVVLGVAIKGKMQDRQGERAGKRLTKEEAIKEIQGKINDEIVGIFSKNSSENKMIGLKIKSSNSLTGESTDSWISNASTTYQY